MREQSWIILALVFAVVGFATVFSLVSTSGVAFTTIEPPSGSSPEATAGDTLIFAAGSNMTISGDASTDTITFTSAVTGSGATVAVDIGDNSVDDISALVRISTTGDTNSIFAESPADELNIAVSAAWPLADALSANPTNCAVNTKADDSSANGDLICSQTDTGDITNGTILPEDLDDDIDSPFDEECLTYESGPVSFEWQSCSAGSGDITDVGDCSTGACFTAGGTGSTLHLEGATADAFETIIATADVTGDHTFTFPNAQIADDDALVGNGAGTFEYIPIEDCDGSNVNRQQYDTATNTWGCDTDGLLPGDLDDAADTPADEECLTYEGTGAVFEWQTCSAGSGDITDVGDCSTGACFTADGTGSTLHLEGATADAFETIIATADVTGDHTFTFPNAQIADDDALVGTGAGTFGYVPIEDCDGSNASRQQYDTATNTWGCDTDGFTTAEISGLDVSDDLNLTAGRSLTLTGDDVLADAELYTFTTCMRIEDPTAADDFESIDRNSTANAYTVTEIWAESDQTVAFDLQIDDGTPADVNGTDITPAAGEAEDTTLSGDTTLGVDEELDLVVTSVTNTPTWVSICWTVTVND